jgi:hypothetical protein
MASFSCFPPYEIGLPPFRIRPVRGNQYSMRRVAFRNSSHNMDRSALPILLQNEHARPLIVLRVIFDNDSFSNPLYGIPEQNTIMHHLIVSMVRNQTLLILTRSRILLKALLIFSNFTMSCYFRQCHRKSYRFGDARKLDCIDALSQWRPPTGPWDRASACICGCFHLRTSAIETRSLLPFLRNF